MKKLKHTPGPWSAFIAGNTVAVDIGAVPHGTKPNIVDWQGFDGCDLPLKQRIANAKLIAAAPDMLDALRELMDDDAPWDDMRWADACDKARAAITKATGI